MHFFNIFLIHTNKVFLDFSFPNLNAYPYASTRGFFPQFFNLVIGCKPPKINLALIDDFWRNNILFNKKKIQFLAILEILKLIE